MPKRKAYLLGYVAIVCLGVNFALPVVFGDVSAIVAAEEVFDGHDWEIKLSTQSGDVYFTINEVDDRAVTWQASTATWQRLQSTGWEIMAWEIGSMERIITSDVWDDVAPVTDSRFIAWQRHESDRWRIVRYDLENGGTWQVLSDPRLTSLHPEIKDGAVIWQTWLDNNWEIMSWNTVTGLARLTTNTLPDIEPDISNEFAVWEGVDPVDLDREILAADFATGEITVLTDNRDNDHLAVFGVDDNVSWVTNLGPSAQQVSSLDVATEFAQVHAIKAIFELIPELVEEILRPCSSGTDEMEVQMDEQIVEPCVITDIIPEETALIEAIMPSDESETEILPALLIDTIMETPSDIQEDSQVVESPTVVIEEQVVE